MLDKYTDETCPYPDGTAVDILRERGERGGRGEREWNDVEKSERFHYLRNALLYPRLFVKQDA